MLCRDISENNIIITTPVAEGDPKGRLIDMDLGKELNSVPSGASHRTGTMHFMAIEILQGKGHTYRHDLESFFYVFIWMCIRYGHNGEHDGEESAAPSSKPNRRRVRPTKSSIPSPTRLARRAAQVLTSAKSQRKVRVVLMACHFFSIDRGLGSYLVSASRQPFYFT
jgi:hypothetical protein